MAQTNRILLDAEVRRLHERQVADQRNIITDALVLAGELAAERAGAPRFLMVLLAEPKGAPHDFVGAREFARLVEHRPRND